MQKKKKKGEKALTIKQHEQWSLLTQIQIFIFSNLCCENQALTHAQFQDMTLFSNSCMLYCAIVSLTTDVKPHC